MKNQIILLLSIIFFSNAANATKIEYFLSMPEPHTHYFEVEVKITDFEQEFIDFKLPVWAPGSYMIREYAKNVEGFIAKTGTGKILKNEKTRKNTWRVFSENADIVTITYRVYAFEASVRTSFLDDSHGYVNGTSVFMFVPQLLKNPLTVNINPYKTWKQITTGLEAAGNNKFILQAPDYDILVDSPIEIGNQKVLEFTADGGTKYEVAMYGEAVYNEKTLIGDMKAVVEEAGKVVGVNPNKRYVFLIHNYLAGGGGLEHLNSTTLEVSRLIYQNNYIGFLTLVAHEYFHLWNVKRIRGKALGPFDYDNENYTHLLWVAEGFTSYYEDLILRRAGLTTSDAFLNTVIYSIGGIENQPGNTVQSLAESSWDAWIKYYRPNENSSNTTISYYTKGSVVASLLDLEIMNSTNAEKTLDDVLKFLYNEYYKKEKRGFTDQEMQQAVEKISGKSMSAFFENYVFGTKAIDYEKYFNYAGFKINPSPVGGNEGFLGATTNNNGGKINITSVYRGAAAHNFGLNVNDEIIAVDNNRLSSGEELNKYFSSKKVGDKINVLLTRDGLIRSIDITLGKNPQQRFIVEKIDNPSPLQEKVLKKWLKL